MVNGTMDLNSFIMDQSSKKSVISDMRLIKECLWENTRLSEQHELMDIIYPKLNKLAEQNELEYVLSLVLS
jgi:hypothetical protein